MPIHPHFCRSGQALSALLLGVLLVACASPVPAPLGASRTAERAVAGGPAVSQAPAVPVAAAAVVPVSPLVPVPIPAPSEVAAAPVDAMPAAPAGDAASPDQTLAKGMASWYGPKFHGRRTASGELYDMHGLTAAHKTLPFGTRVRVRSVYTGKEVVVRINDRGPYKHSRIIDLSLGAISALGLRHRGVTEVVLLRE
jgi:rare lipoprotein A